jgi:hypothetical protein
VYDEHDNPVRLIQWLAHQASYHSCDLGEHMTSHFDSDTVSEVKCFQTYDHVTGGSDGIVGINTWTDLKSDVITDGCSCTGCEYEMPAAGSGYIFYILYGTIECPGPSADLNCHGTQFGILAGNAGGQVSESPGDCEQ